MLETYFTNVVAGYGFVENHLLVTEGEKLI